MLGLTSLGVVHTAIGLVAVGAGLVALARDHAITLRTRIGRVYVVTTVLTCLTSLGIFRHGGFGKPHALALLTLLVLGVAALVGTGRWLGRRAIYVEALAYSVTVFFHFVPAVTETFTRLPTAAPLFANADDPALARVIAVLFAVFVAGAAVQLLTLRAQLRSGALARIQPG